MFKSLGISGTGVTLGGGGEPELHKNFREILVFEKKSKIDMGLKNMCEIGVV